MFFNSIKKIDKETNRLLSKEISNISLKFAIDEKC